MSNITPKNQTLLNNNIKNEFSDVLNTLSTFKKCVTTLQSQIKLLEKTINKEMRSIEKKQKKRRNVKNIKPLSGFAAPGRVTDELCKFMGKPTGSLVARTEVTKYIMDYIKKNNMQDPITKKNIVPDSSLKKLLSINDCDSLTYFNIQKYMNKHFIKENV